MARKDHGELFRKGAAAVLMEQATEALPARTLLLGAYERISDDQEDEETGDRGAGVNRQRDAIEKLCAYRTSGASVWTIHRHYTDNDISAYKDIVRPEFENLLADLAAGIIEGIVVYDLDRLARRPKDLERVIEVYEKAAQAGRKLSFATSHDNIDLSSPDGLTLARVMVAFANKASRDTARRVAAKHRSTALTGRPVGGTRPFGWNWTDGTKPLKLKDGRAVPAGARQHVVNEAEAKIIQQIATDVLLGVSLNTICRDLNERGIRTTRGNEWLPGPLKLMLESPRLAGYRVHQGTFLPMEDGSGFVKGHWDPILDEDTWHQLFVKLRGKSSTKARSESHATYLLSGILQCYLCGGAMSGNARANLGHFYACKVRTGVEGKSGCAKVSCSGRPVDELVTTWAKQRMRDSTIDIDDESAWPREEELVKGRRQLQDLLPQLTEATGDARMLLNSEFARLSDAVEAMREERNTWLLDRGSRRRRARVGPETFDAMPVEQQRAYLRGELVAILVKPATRRSNKFDYSRLVPVWRETGETSRQI